MLQALYRISTLPAATDLVSLAEAKVHLRLDGITLSAAEDTELTDFITAAYRMAADFLQNPILNTIYKGYAPNWDSEIVLPPCPLVSVDTVEYYAEDASSTTEIDNTGDEYYYLDLISEPGRLVFHGKGDSLPTVETDRPNPIIITFTAGLGANKAAIPGPIRSAMLLTLGHLYENRQEVVVGRQVNQLPQAAEYLLRPYCRYPFAS